MNWLDILIIILLGIGLIEGFKTGLVLQLTGIVALVLALLFVSRIVPYIIPYLSGIGSLSHATISIIAYCVGFIVIVLIVFCIGFFIHVIFKLPILNSLNKLLGALFSVTKWGIVFAVILFAFSKIDSNGKILSKSTRDHSMLYSYLIDIPQTILDKVRK